MSGRIVGSVCAVALTAAAALATPVPSAPAAAAPPAERSVAELLTQLKTLYRKAEESTEEYNATEEKLRRQRARTRALTVALARTRGRLAISHDDAGRLAREQYQDRTPLSSYSFLLALLAPSPDQAAEQSRELSRAADRQAIVVERLTRGEAYAEGLAKRARAALRKQLALAMKRKKQRDKVEKRLTAIERTLASLSRRQLRAIEERERRDTEKAQRDLLASGALDPPAARAHAGPDAATDSDHGTGGEGPSPEARDTSAPDPEATGTGTAEPEEPEHVSPRPKEPTPRTTAAPHRAPRRPLASAAAGQRALRYAMNQIGKPYVWGAEGPGSFDCSGLTSQAWAHAGRPIPRTSQEQWRRLPHVKLNRLRPGDLVVYFKGASHVAIYAGNGMVVQAPRPGTRVKLSPLASNPLRGAVRPTKG
ncbi:C40 family peptidase [Streptomyces sparsogenes]|uniref:C40 family peptidase n=1 Tax=Streptomyces sparsogenes TaxID=67365 RepID=UPI000825E31B|nr:C40 family peptidase [Streptomyces sparsogenes]